MNLQKASLVIGTLTLFVVGSDIFMSSPLLPFIGEEFRLSAGYTGWMVTLYAIVYAIGCPFWGSMSDRKGRKYFVIAGLFGLALANFVASLATSFHFLILSRMLTGFALSSIAPIVYAMVADVAPPDKKGSWLSITVAGHLTGLALGTPLGSTMEYFFGWRAVYAALAAVGLLLAVTNYLLLPEKTAAVKSVKSSVYSLKEILPSVSITALWSAAMYGVYTYLGAGLHLQHQYSSLEIGRVLIVYGVGAMSGSILAGRLSDRFCPKLVSTVTLLCLFLFQLLLGLSFGFEDLLAISIFLWAIVGYAYIPSYQARLVGEYSNEKGKIMAWNITAMYVGMTLGSLFGGAVITLYGFEALAISCGCVALIAADLSRRVGRADHLETADYR